MADHAPQHDYHLVEPSPWPATSPRRLDEYADDEQHAQFIVGDLVPEVEKHYSVLKDPGARGILGALLARTAGLGLQVADSS